MQAGNTSDEIFQELKTIIFDKEFETAQHAFFEKNYDQFEDTEENKLIYTQIYE
jgi:ADP-ribosylation factor 2-binding protein|tara:strand:+ start:105 stop:266 length:162 start_codon:yes stop_codon:yes gene_type:complete